MNQEDLAYTAPASAEPVIAGTLVLMSLFRHTACPRAAQKIAHNLNLLSKTTDVSEEFRILCGRLCEQCGISPPTPPVPQVPRLWPRQSSATP